jgi:aldose 1-epimerase
MNYGSIITEISVLDKFGQFRDIALGFSNLEQYKASHPYFGATIGRVANRIAGSKFELNGKVYQLASNHGPNHLHGGLKGYDKVVWTPEVQDDSLVLRYLSPDGEEGYPGNLNITVEYSFTDENELVIEYKGRSDKDTPVNLTNHSYFNLDGEGSDSILDHNLTINADHFLPTLADNVPNGEILPVSNTVFDFRTIHSIGDRIFQKDEQLQYGCGYDHNYVLNHTENLMGWVSTVQSTSSGIVMEVYSTEPGVQFYSGNLLDGSLIGKSGAYRYRSGFCLETQKFPNGIHNPGFPDTVLKKETNYTSRTVYKFLRSV